MRAVETRRSIIECANEILAGGNDRYCAGIGARAGAQCLHSPAAARDSHGQPLGRMDRTGLSFLFVGPGRRTRRIRLADEKPHAPRAHREPRAGPLGRFRYRPAACRCRLARQRCDPESPGAGVVSRARPQDAGRAIATGTRRQSLGSERYLPGMAGRCAPLARRSARTGADGRGSRPRSGFRSNWPLRRRPSRARWRRPRVHRARCRRARVDDRRLGRRTIGNRSQRANRSDS